MDIIGAIIAGTILITLFLLFIYLVGTNIGMLLVLGGIGLGAFIIVDWIFDIL